VSAFALPIVLARAPMPGGVVPPVNNTTTTTVAPPPAPLDQNGIVSVYLGEELLAFVGFPLIDILKTFIRSFVTT